MGYSGQISDEELRELEKKCEDLIALAVDLGARASFHAIRRQLSNGRKFRLREPFLLVQAHLEDHIAGARRDQLRRASRRPLTVKFKNLIGL